MQRPNMTPKFRERLARDAENVNAINRHGDIATRIAEKIYHIGAVRKAMRSLTPVDADRTEVREAITTEIASVVSTEIEPLMEVLREAMTHSIIQHASGCGAFNSQPCNCWVSQAQSLIGEENR